MFSEDSSDFEDMLRSYLNIHSPSFIDSVVVHQAAGVQTSCKTLFLNLSDLLQYLESHNHQAANSDSFPPLVAYILQGPTNGDLLINRVVEAAAKSDSSGPTPFSHQHPIHASTPYVTLVVSNFPKHFFLPTIAPACRHSALSAALSAAPGWISVSGTIQCIDLTSSSTEDNAHINDGSTHTTFASWFILSVTTSDGQPLCFHVDVSRVPLETRERCIAVGITVRLLGTFTRTDSAHLQSYNVFTSKASQPFHCFSASSITVLFSSTVASISNLPRDSTTSTTLCGGENLHPFPSSYGLPSRAGGQQHHSPSEESLFHFSREIWTALPHHVVCGEKTSSPLTTDELLIAKADAVALRSIPKSLVISTLLSAAATLVSGSDSLQIGVVMPQELLPLLHRVVKTLLPPGKVVHLKPCTFVEKPPSSADYRVTATLLPATTTISNSTRIIATTKGQSIHAGQASRQSHPLLLATHAVVNPPSRELMCALDPGSEGYFALPLARDVASARLPCPLANAALVLVADTQLTKASADFLRKGSVAVAFSDVSSSPFIGNQLVALKEQQDNHDIGAALLHRFTASVSDLSSCGTLLEAPSVSEDASTFLQLYYRVARQRVPDSDPRMMSTLLRLAAVHTILLHLCLPRSCPEVPSSLSVGYAKLEELLENAPFSTFARDPSPSDGPREDPPLTVSLVDAVVAMSIMECSLSFLCGTNVVGLNFFDLVEQKDFSFVEFVTGLHQYLLDISQQAAP